MPLPVPGFDGVRDLRYSLLYLPFEQLVHHPLALLASYQKRRPIFETRSEQKNASKADEDKAEQSAPWTAPEGCTSIANEQT